MKAPLWLRSVRRRPLIALLLLALSTTGVATSALGPLFVRAVQQSSLTAAIEQAGPARSSVAAVLDLQPDEDLDDAVGNVQQVVSGPLTGAAEAVWRKPQLAVQTTASLGWTPAGSAVPERVSRVASGEDGCSQLAVVAGRCPAASGEALVSRVDAERSRAAVGSVIRFALPSSPVRQLTVVGLYDPDRSSTIDLLRPASAQGQLARVTADPVITTRDQLLALRLGVRVTGRLLLAGTFGTDQEAIARQTIRDVQSNIAAVSGRVLFFDSALPQLLDDADNRVASASVLMLVTVAQAELLTLFALVVALQRLSRSRSAEWGVGRLRGLPTRPWLASIWLEPGTALLLGLPVGLISATGLATAVTSVALRPGTPVEWWRWPVWTAGLVAVAVALVALVLVTLRDARRPLVELLQQAADSRRVDLVAVVAQSTVVLLTGTALYELLSGGVLGAGGSQLGLLAPALFALATAVLAVRVSIAVVKRLTSHAPRSLTGLVVGRHVARAPSTLSPAIVLAAGLALAVFSTQVLALSVRNQGLRALAIVGAPTVLQVSVPDGTDLVQAVAAADPSGASAMAVQERASSSDGGTGRIVAVDSSRIDAVAPWVAGWAEAGPLALALHPTTTASIVLRGSRVELEVDAVRLRTTLVQGFPPPARPPDLTLVVQAGGAAWQRVSLGTLQDQPTTYRGTMSCPDGCRVVGLRLASARGQAYRTTFTLTSLRSDQTPAAELLPRLTQPGGWREQIGRKIDPYRTESASASPGVNGLTITAIDPDGQQENWVVPTDTDDPMPAVLAPELVVQPFSGMPGVLSGTGLDGQGQLVVEAGRASILPRALDDGVLVDLRDAERLADPADSEATKEVWLAADAPVEVEQRLAAAGVVVLARQSGADAREMLLQQGNTRGALVAVWVAMAALLTAFLTLAGARAAEAARRRTDWESLRDSGIAPTTVRRLALVEIAAPALLAAVVGTLSGVAALELGASRLPLVDVYAPGPPLDLHLAWGPLGWLCGAVGVLIIGISALLAVAETRRTEGR